MLSIQFVLVLTQPGSPGGEISREDARTVAAAAGYFRASAKSVIAPTGGAGN